jgi:hypothetical protein
MCLCRRKIAGHERPTEISRDVAVSCHTSKRPKTIAGKNSCQSVRNPKTTHNKSLTKITQQKHHPQKNIAMTSSKNQREYTVLSSYKRRYMGLNIICIREDPAEQEADNPTIPKEFRLPNMSPTAPISFGQSSKRPLPTIPSEIFIGSPEYQSPYQEQHLEQVQEAFQGPSLHHRTDTSTIVSSDEFPLQLIESPGSKRRLRNRALSDTDVERILLALME